MTDSLMPVNLVAVFNQRDAERRLRVIADDYTEGVIWTDPEEDTCPTSQT